MPLQEPPSYITLPSGDRMPSLGLGCWQSPPSELSSAVNHALKSGYRHIDGATIYGNEHAMGEGIRQSGIPREDIWVTTKLWNSDHRPEDVLPALERSLGNLGLEYLDLWLMHYPAATSDQGVLDIPYTETWRAMEECVKLGLVRNIGISNFSKKEVEILLASCRIKPALHQLEKHPYLPQNAFCKWHKEIGLHITAYSPLGNTNPSFAAQDKFPPCQENPAVRELAQKYDITPANVLISLQLSEGHSVLPKSVTLTRITENLKVVQLPDEDLQLLYRAFEGMRHRYCDFSDIIGYKYYEGLDDSD